MAANGKRHKQPDRMRELRLRVAVEHPGWSDERIRAELIRAQLGAGDYAKIRARGRRA